MIDLAKLDAKRGKSKQDLGSIGENGRSSKPKLSGQDLERGRTRAVLTFPDSKFADIIDDLRIDLITVGAGRPQKLLLIASPEPGTGKTVIAANLAHALAKTGKSTLLIDADAHTRTLSNLFSLTGDMGLNDVVKGTVPLDAAVTQDNDSGLYFLPVGQKYSSLETNDMMAAQRVASFLKDHRNDYDAVIIDGPAILNGRDIQTLFAASDRALLVTEKDRTTPETIRRALGHAGKS